MEILASSTDTKFSRFTSALKRDHYFFLETGPGFWASVLRRLDERTNVRNVSFIYLRWKLHPCQPTWYQILSTSKSAKYISWCLWTTSLIYLKQIVLVLDIRLHSRLQLFQSPFRFFNSHFNPWIISFASKTEASTWTFDFTCHSSSILTSLSQFACYTQHSLSSPSEAVTINCDEANFPLLTQSDEDEQSCRKRKLTTYMKRHRSLVSHNTRLNYCFPLLYLIIFHKANRSWACRLKTSLLQKIEELRAREQVRITLKFCFCRGKLFLQSQQPCISEVKKWLLITPAPPPGTIVAKHPTSFLVITVTLISYYIPNSSVKNRTNKQCMSS